MRGLDRCLADSPLPELMWGEEEVSTAGAGAAVGRSLAPPESILYC
jgi:hypothetical protein